ncbi:unnamed protein product [Cuscuta campestris]|uniref:UDP-glycosyltransferases domain-containing protein n=1 Tax=Cuscuta campestris TaxID=132261 RepID=A0A484NHB0_9ASTE|nr:unnamed protein product [Cuscuta campestris]
MIDAYALKSLEDAVKADIIISNTAFELEPSTITALQQHKPFYAIGPVSRYGLPEAATTVPTNFRPESAACLPWLDARPENSVLYVSFWSVVEVWKVGIDLCGGKAVGSEEVREKTNRLMSREGLGEKIETTKEILQRAVSANGSSQKHLETLMHEVKLRTQQKHNFLEKARENCRAWKKRPETERIEEDEAEQQRRRRSCGDGSNAISRPLDPFRPPRTQTHFSRLHRHLPQHPSHPRQVDPLAPAAGESASDIFSDARSRSGLDIRYALIGDGFPLGFDPSTNQEQFIHGLFHVFSAHVDDFLGRLRWRSDVDPPVSCLLTDSFFVWPSMVAEKHGLLNVSFWTQSALVFAIDLPSPLQNSEGPWNVVDTYVLKSLEDAVKADIIVSNTAFELESSTITALQQDMSFYAIGPVSRNSFPKAATVPTSFRPESADFRPWLDARPENSVLYVSFGSLINVDKHVIHEIARGLALSGESFLWAIRGDITGSSADEPDLFPAGFDGEIEGRGLVVPWRLVIEDWKVGINLCDGETVEREEVREKTNRLMSRGATREGLGEKIKTTQEKLQRAVCANGSSEKHLEAFMHEVKLKTQQKLNFTEK